MYKFDTILLTLILFYKKRYREAFTNFKIVLTITHAKLCVNKTHIMIGDQ